MSEIHLKECGYTYNTSGQFTKNMEKTQEFKENEVQDVFISTNKLKAALGTIWLMEILNIYVEEQLLTFEILRHKVFEIVKN